MVGFQLQFEQRLEGEGLTLEEKFYFVTWDVFNQMKGPFIEAYTYNPNQKERNHATAKMIAKLTLKASPISK